MTDLGWKAADWLMAALGMFGAAVIGLVFKEIASLRREIADARQDAEDGDAALALEIDGVRKDARDGDDRLRVEFQTSLAAMRAENTVAFGKLFDKLDATSADLNAHRVMVAKMISDFMPRAELRAELAALRPYGRAAE